MTLPSAPNGGPLGGSLSIHSDVLNAPIPPTKEGKDGLVSELKSRARLTMASGNYPLAEAFYGKAVEVLSGCEGVKHDLAVLYANRSLARLNQNKKDDAIEDATLSVSHDSLYVKGHWRLGSAYSGAGRYAEAYDAFKCGLEVDPSNKPFEREIDKCRAKMTESKIKKKKSPKAEKTKPTASPSPTSSKSVSQKSRDVSTSAAVDAEDKSLFKKSEPIRGYKIVNGKKTSFFHHEQTEEEKALIGDITPKMLDIATTSTAQDVESEERAPAVSAWNTAGTWEEKGVTAWAKETLRKAILDVSYTFGTEPIKITISAIDKMDGHASFATVRMKRRYIYEFELELSWELKNMDEVLASGKIIYPDVDGTCDGTYESSYSVIKGDAKFCKAYVSERGLKSAVDRALDGWIELFKSTYAM